LCLLMTRLSFVSATMASRMAGQITYVEDFLAMPPWAFSESHYPGSSPLSLWAFVKHSYPTSFNPLTRDVIRQRLGSSSVSCSAMRSALLSLSSKACSYSNMIPFSLLFVDTSLQSTTSIPDPTLTQTELLAYSITKYIDIF
jgi:hypothetical protein